MNVREFVQVIVVAAIVRRKVAKVATHLQLKAAIFASLQK
jgi:hypothetical protein